jgi:hypothetical protein
MTWKAASSTAVASSSSGVPDSITLGTTQHAAEDQTDKAPFAEETVQ